MKSVRFAYIITALLVLANLSSCKDDEPQVSVQEGDPAAVRQSEATYNSLAFSWDDV